MKYLFEIEREIKNCYLCPFSKVSDFDDNELFCRLKIKYFNGDEMPDDCSLQKVDDVLDELKETLEVDKPVNTATTAEPFTADQLKETVEKVKLYIPLKHCGNCEYCNKYKEQEPCDSCKKQSNWKKRIFY